MRSQHLIELKKHGTHMSVYVFACLCEFMCFYACVHVRTYSLLCTQKSFSSSCVHRCTSILCGRLCTPMHLCICPLMLVFVYISFYIHMCIRQI